MNVNQDLSREGEQVTVLGSRLVQVEQESVRLQGVVPAHGAVQVSSLCLCRDKKLPGPASFQPTQCKAAASQPVLQLKYLISICSFHSANQREVRPKNVNCCCVVDLCPKLVIRRLASGYS